jgi:hypothetical protein
MEGEDMFNRVSRAIARVLDGQGADGPRIVNSIFFGEEDPGQLVIYLAYEDSRTLASARKGGDTGRVQGALLAALRDEGYPDRPIRIEFISEEEVEKSGGPFKYFTH